MLALLAERASGVGFHELVRTLVCEPAGMVDTAFLRSDELPGRAARATWPSTACGRTCCTSRSSVSATAACTRPRPTCSAFWEAFFAGRIVGADSVARDGASAQRRGRRSPSATGSGFHLAATGDEVWLEGYDAGVSFGSSHTPSTATTFTVISNWTDGAWPVVKLLDERLGS